MLTKIQNDLIRQYPHLQRKSDILQYYVSLQYPQKQRKLIVWWEQMIDAAVRASGEAYLSPADLQIIFSLHGLKPVPLEKVLQHLASEKKIQWDAKIQQKNKQQSGSGWWSGVTSYIWKSNTQNVTKSGFKSMQLQQNSKVFPTKYKNQLLFKIKNIIKKQLQHQKSINYDYLFSKLKQQINLSIQSLEVLLDYLEKTKWLVIENVQNKKIIFHSDNNEEMNDRNWVQIQKSKYTLKSAIELFDIKIGQRMHEQAIKLQQVKQCVENDQNKARRILGQVRAIRKTTDEWQNRRKLLKQSLDQLELNEINLTTVDVMGQCQKIIQKTMVDTSEIQKLKDKHMQIVISQKQVNEQLQQMRSMDQSEIQDEANNMMAELQRQIQKKKIQKQKQQMIANNQNINISKNQEKQQYSFN